ncbi:MULTISPECIES: stage III sporulation protein AE [Clostridium]|uniref:Stage III sporulation protein AE n=2 Tax=Clostridium TaxID=1485 RepID=A0A151AQF1_9CLOT|nr:MULTISPECIES: stage III sporulation protein AE [Clostridium]KYH29812.1 stage III sporulation protein AE precursor [Clostridium colicanis DSM 13634]PRR75193.1 Stage III sporulation protein AE [Clostridium thermopalmarium DSM 5974]PVZ27949.1 stage III sporulation protein AE [Clostridium thermopalmarium DSM 5974]
MKRLIIILILFLLIPLNVQAFESAPMMKQEEIQQVEQLYNYMTNMKTKYEILNDIDIKAYVKDYMKNGDGKLSTKKIFKALMSYGFREVIACGKLMYMIIIICIICALINNLENAFSNGNLSNIAYFACYSLLIILISRTFYIGVSIVREAIKDMTDFMAALMPVLLILLASVGGFSQAAVMDPIIIGVINISARIFVNLIIPIIGLSFVIQFVNNISQEYKVDNLSKLLNKSALWIQGIIMTIFIGTVTIRSMATATIDAVTEKTAKFAVDSFIPIVGKSLSDAISTVAGYSLLLKNALSSIGLIILIAILIFPVIKIVVMAFIYKLTAALIEPISDSRLVKCIASAGDSLILINSCLISVSVMFFIIISIIASAGRSILGG